MRPEADDSTERRWSDRLWSFTARAIGLGLLALFTATYGVGCGDGEGNSEQQSTPDAGSDATTGSDTTEAPDADGDHEHPPVDQTLGPDGVAVTEAAVFVAPKRSGLDRIVAIESEAVSGVTDETPLPVEATQVADYSIEVSAGRNVDLSSDDQGLYMIVPVPSSFDGDPSELAVAARLPAGLGLSHGDQIDPSIENIWTVQPGYYIPEANAFAFPLHFLIDEGSEFALVQSDAYDSYTLEFPERDFGSAVQNASTEQELYRTRRAPLIHKTKVGRAVGNAVKSVVDAIGEAFEAIGEEVSEEVKKAIEKVVDTVEEAKACVQNRGWETREDFFIKCRSLDCNDAEKSEARAQLKRVHDQYRPEFHKPDLTRTLPCKKMEVETSDGGTETKWGRFYAYNLREDGTGQCSGGTLGMYVPPTHTALTCYDGSGPDAISERTTRMEYFHGVQFNYAPVSWPNWANKSPGSTFFPKWIIEGTASAVENTNTTPEFMHRDGERDLRPIDRPITATGDGVLAYRIQDLWTYVVNARSSTTEETYVALFSAQAGIPNKPDLLKANYLFDLEKHHWGWVRNQAFEARMTEGFGDALGETCVPNSDVWGSPKTTLQYDPTAASSPLRRTVGIDENFTAEVANIEVNNSSSSKPFKIFVTAEGNQPVKAYPARTSASRACLHRDEPLRETALEDGLPANTSQTYHVLMGNPRPLGDASFDIKVEHLGANGDRQPPTARVVKPPAGEDIAWNGATLEAEASDPGGGPIATYDWKVSHAGVTLDDVDGDGVPGSDGNPVTLSKLPDDQNVFDDSATIELTVTDLEGQTVTVTETRRPKECRTLGRSCANGDDCCTGACARSGGGAGFCIGG